MNKLKIENIKEFVESCGYYLISNEYINTNSKISLADKEGYKYFTTFHLFQKNKGAERYHKSNIYSIENIHKYIINNDLKYILVSTEYIDANKKLEFICNNNHSCYISWHNFNHERRCNKCYSISKRKTDEEFRSELFDKYNGEYSLIEEYKNNRDKILFLHNTCGTYFKTRPFNILGRGDGCPICSISKGERKCIDWLNSNNYKYEREYIFDDLISDKNAFLRYDFAVFIKDKTFLIEYDGEFHFRNVFDEDAFKRRKMLDRQKDNYALDNNMSLLRIPYWEYENTEKILNEALLEQSNSAFLIKKGSELL